MRRVVIWVMAVAALVMVAGGAAAEPSRDVLDNGLVVITSPGGGVSIAAIEVMITASALDEPEDKAGLRQLVQQTLVRGSRNMSGDELAAALDDLGVRLDTGLGLDYVEVSAVCLSSDLERVIQLLAEVVRRPTFPESEVEGRREIAERYADAVRTRPFDLAQLLVRRGLFDGHPYSRPTEGTVASLAAVTRDDLVSFHRLHYVPNATIISVAGGPSREAVLAMVRSSLGDWARGESRMPASPAIRAPRQSVLALREGPVANSHLLLAYSVGPTRPDAYPVNEVVRSLLGVGVGSRLYKTLREDAALAYDAGAQYFAYRCGGYLAAYVPTANSDLESVRELTVKEFERLRAKPPTAAEMRRAQELAIGVHALALQRTKDRAFLFAWREALGLGYDFDQRYGSAIRAVTPQHVGEVAQRYLSHYALGLVVPEQ